MIKFRGYLTIQTLQQKELFFVFENSNKLATTGTKNPACFSQFLALLYNHKVYQR
jgi:hypothetical protein